MILRHLLRSWLGAAAKQTLREKVADAAREHAEAAAEEVERTQSEPLHVGFVFALSIEAAPLKARLEDVVSIRAAGFSVQYGSLREQRVAVAVSGSGRESAARATEALIDAHRPDWLVSAGFAGGLHPDLRHHDILMVDHLVDPRGERLSIDLKIDPDSLAASEGLPAGRRLTVDSVVRLPEQKELLGRQHAALAVDMESFAVAEVCRRRQVRFLAIRVITDPVDEPLPPDIEQLLTQKTPAAQLGAAAGAIWRRPASFKDMVRLRENSQQAARRLAKFLCGVIERL